jgi:hypothetical protein
MSVILATWVTEIGMITVQGQTGQINHETPISKITRAKWTGGVYGSSGRAPALQA